ncbi:MAG: GAF domain-containing protein [Rhodocyclales bacterium]|nr:GAF domain-containing protein [Rhodocyclales bacterium]
MKELLRNPDAFCKILGLTVSSLSVDDIMTRVVDELSDLFGCDRCTVYVVDKKTNELYTKVAQKCRIGNFRIPIDPNQSLSSFVALTGREILVDDAYDDSELKQIDKNLCYSPDRDAMTLFKTKEVLSVPLKMHGEIIGVLQAMNKPGGFLKKDLDAMREFSPILTLALNHALLVEELAACKA